MKNTKHIKVTFILVILYLVASIVHSYFWCDIISPVIILNIFIIMFHTMYIKQTLKINRIIGLLLSLGMLSWFMADVLWAVYSIIYHIDPINIDLIAYLYGFTNLFLALSLTLFVLQVLRKWNIVQIILDTLVMSFLTLDFIWIVFLHEDSNRILMISDDMVSSISILLDVMILIMCIICIMSFKVDKFPVFVRLISAGFILFSVTDLFFYYQYMYSTYEPNSLIDALYIISFLFIAVAGLMQIRYCYSEEEIVYVNVGRKGKINLLLLAPIFLIVFKGFYVTYLLQFVSVILIYNMISTYVQNNLYKESLLKKELEHNHELEQKVKERTEELEESNRILQLMNNQDYVTGLYNRKYLLMYLQEACNNIKFEDTIALLYIDLNRYKLIKTMFGHDVGEKILLEFAKKIKPVQKLAGNSILASYGDDTYIFAAIGPYDYENGHEFAEEVIRLGSDIYHIGEYQISITMSIGISIYPFDAITQEGLIKHADIAMTQARSQGYNMIREFDLKLNGAFLRKSNIELLLKKANYKQEFMVYYQPQLLTHNRKIVGFEALLRWKAATGEFISPAEFIPIAEETGCIIPIGEWVMKRVMYQLLEWNNYFDEKIMIGFNVSLKQLNSAEFIEKLKEEIRRLQVNPEWIDLEITESFQMVESQEMLKMLEDIRRLGVRVSVDDFGTGYSSLSYLKNLPVDRIKLAKELIDSIHTDDFDYQLVKSIIQLSKIKGIRVIAEGVETKEQWETLKELGCDEVQGFYFGRPMSAQDIEQTFHKALLEKQRFMA